MGCEKHMLCRMVVEWSARWAAHIKGFLKCPPDRLQHTHDMPNGFKLSARWAATINAMPTCVYMVRPMGYTHRMVCQSVVQSLPSHVLLRPIGRAMLVYQVLVGAHGVGHVDDHLHTMCDTYAKTIPTPLQKHFLGRS